MAEPETDPFEALKRVAEHYARVKLGRGLVGKTAAATVAVLVLWGFIVWRLSGNPWLDIALLACGAAGTAVCAWWIRKTYAFAEKYPGIALLEGAELLEYQRFEAQAKGLLPAPSGERVLPTPPQVEDKT